jgi:hypothetical protein
MKLWKKVLIGILIFLVVLLGGVAFLIGTTPGLHLVLKGASRWVPGLSIKQVDGGWRNLTLNGLRSMPGKFIWRWISTACCTPLCALTMSPCAISASWSTARR